MARGLQVRLPEFWTDIMDVLSSCLPVSTCTELVAGPQSGQSRVLSKIRFLQVFSRLPNNNSLFSHFKPPNKGVVRVEEGSLGGSANHFPFGLAAISSTPPFCFLMQVPKFPLKPWRFGCYVKSSFVAPCFEGCSDVNRGDARSAVNCLSPVSLRHPRVIFLSLSIAVYFFRMGLLGSALNPHSSGCCDLSR